MIKFLLVSVVLYYIVSRYLQPSAKIEVPDNRNDKQDNQNRKKNDDDYIEYEEVN